jgi:hypothetical protein
MLKQLQVLVQSCTVEVTWRLKPERHVVSIHPSIHPSFGSITLLQAYSSPGFGNSSIFHGARLFYTHSGTVQQPLGKQAIALGVIA